MAAFGLLLPRLGFYWDDWRVIYIAQQGDMAALWRFFQYDRPFSPWTYMVTFPILGLSPLPWQLFNLGLRFLTAALMWLTLGEVWPSRRFTTAAAVLLFAVYPSFTQQFIAVSYSQHFITYSLFFLSMWAMLRGEGSSRRWAWNLLAFSTAVAHLATMEYFAGLELIRPVPLYFYWTERKKTGRVARQKAVNSWLPYLGLLAVFFVWRFFFAGIVDDPNRPSLLSALRAAPLATLLALIESSLGDLVQILITPWGLALNAEVIRFSDRGLLLALGMAVLVAAGLFWYLRVQFGRGRSGSDEWGGQAIALGLLAILLGLLPVRLAERDLAGGLFSDRYTLPGLFGAALVWAGAARLALRTQAYRALLMAALIGLAVGLHLRVANEYRWDWEEQRRDYWQLYWRAPSIATNTALVFDGAFSAYVSEYAASFAINTLYHASSVDEDRLPYWVVDFYDDLNSDAEYLEFAQRNYRFQAVHDAAMYFDLSGADHCLWLLTPLDSENRDVDAPMRAVAADSQVARIGPGGKAPDAAIFGAEPPHGWCYYYQKIDLAVQSQEWARAEALWEEAQNHNLQPLNQYELIPLVRAYAASGQWNEALDLSLEMARRQRNVKPALCLFWTDAQGDLANEARASLSCDE